MNIIRHAVAPAILAAAMAFTACGDKVTPVLIEQGERLDNELKTLASENPALFGELSASYTDNSLVVDVAIKDSLLTVQYITEPLFNFFTACQIKNHLDKNLEITVNALSEKEAPLVVNLTDVYGEAKTYELKPATLRYMVKSMLSQLATSEVRENLYTLLDASKEDFRPVNEGFVEGVTSSFNKSGFYTYTVEFKKGHSAVYSQLTTANLKARALKVLEAQFDRLGTMRQPVLEMLKALGIDGFHLVYTTDGKNTIKTTIPLSNLK